AAVRTPPHSIEAEQSVLGGLLLDNTAWDRIADLVGTDDFYRNDHRLIFAAISRLVDATKPADAVTAFESLRNANRGENPGHLGHPRPQPLSGAMPTWSPSVQSCAVWSAPAMRSPPAR